MGSNASKEKTAVAKLRDQYIKKKAERKPSLALVNALKKKMSPKAR